MPPAHKWVKLFGTDMPKLGVLNINNMYRSRTSPRKL
jgi:hypothetical protein